MVLVEVLITYKVFVVPPVKAYAVAPSGVTATEVVCTPVLNTVITEYEVPLMT